MKVRRRRKTNGNREASELSGSQEEVVADDSKHTGDGTKREGQNRRVTKVGEELLLLLASNDNEVRAKDHAEQRGLEEAAKHPVDVEEFKADAKTLRAQFVRHTPKAPQHQG